MYGYITAGKRVSVTRRQIGGVWFMAAAMPQRGLLARYSRRRVWRLLRRNGVTRCVLPRWLAAEAAEMEILPVPVCGLRRALLPQLLDMQGDLRRSAAVLRADHVSAAVYDAAVVLARRVRYLSLETGGGTERLALALRQRFGLCDGGMAEPAVTVTFGGIPAGNAICLGEDCWQHQQVTYHLSGTDTAAAASSEQLLAVLFEEGRIKKEQIRVKTIAANA